MAHLKYIGLTEIKLIGKMGDVMQSIAKCERFGFWEGNLDGPDYNVDELQYELGDLLRVLHEYKAEIDERVRDGE